MRDSELTATVKGLPVEDPDAPAPVMRTLPDGQHADHWVLPEEDRKKGRVRPYRVRYKHVGLPMPKNQMRDLTPEEQERYKHCNYVKFEVYPESESPKTGRFWTAEEMKRINNGCQTETTMPVACAETYAVKPDAYGQTFCCRCGAYFKVGENGEFVWCDDGTRVGT